MYLLLDFNVLLKNIFRTLCEISSEPFSESYIRNYSSVGMCTFTLLPSGPLLLKRKIYWSNNQYGCAHYF